MLKNHLSLDAMRSACDGLEDVSVEIREAPPDVIDFPAEYLSNHDQPRGRRFDFILTSNFLSIYCIYLNTILISCLITIPD